ncbi:MAG TPA: hypothetical protein VE981_20175, partial [Planctomycetota bacterium]|nr:hypothetical protein [Planctomycetota bacterium]
SLFELLEAVKPYEKSYLKLVATVPDAAARATLSSDLAALFLVGRVIRQANEGSQTPIGSVSEADEDKKIEASVAFTVDVAEYAPAVKECEAAVAALKASLDTLATEVAAGATDETNLIGFIRNERPRVLLAERMMAARDEQRGKADEIMASTLEEDFTANGERLTVKKGKYVDDDGAESADALKAAIETVREEFAGTIREDFDRIAERCVDSEVIGVLENRPGTYLLMDFRDRVLDRLVHDVRRQGLAVFIRAYLVKQGEEYSVRPDRTVRVEALLKRAEAIRKEQEK